MSKGRDFDDRGPQPRDTLIIRGWWTMREKGFHHATLIISVSRKEMLRSTCCSQPTVFRHARRTQSTLPSVYTGACHYPILVARIIIITWNTWILEADARVSRAALNFRERNFRHILKSTKFARFYLLPLRFAWPNYHYITSYLDHYIISYSTLTSL